MNQLTLLIFLFVFILSVQSGRFNIYKVIIVVLTWLLILHNERND